MSRKKSLGFKIWVNNGTIFQAEKGTGLWAGKIQTCCTYTFERPIQNLSEDFHQRSEVKLKVMSGEFESYVCTRNVKPLDRISALPLTSRAGKDRGYSLLYIPRGGKAGL